MEKSCENGNLPAIASFLMESQKTDDEDRFYDALDEFPFYDCLNCEQSDPSTSDLPSSLRRRTFSPREISSKKSGGSTPEPSTIEGDSETCSREPIYKLDCDFKANEKTFNTIDSTRNGLNSARVIQEKRDIESILSTTTNDELVDPSRNLGDLSNELSEASSSSSSFPVFIAGLLIKAIEFQLNLLISFITLPLSVLSCSYMFIIDPFQALRLGRACIVTKLLNLWNSTCGYLSPMMSEWLKDHKPLLTLVFRFGWGLLCAIFVGIVLCGLMFTSVLISGVLMRYLVEEPMEIKEMLNFDYTKNSPVAFVPIVSCAAVGCGIKCMEKMDAGKNAGSRVIPTDHKLQVTISLTLPESEYNRNLGMFQVRVDFLSINGETLASSSQPCMLKFKSEPIRLLLTIFMVAPLVTGYASEAQTLNLKIQGLNEGFVPSACLRVVIEQRAEFTPGAGIPELYDASLILQSELPLIKRMIWYWKRTIFIWTSLTLFMMELLFTLVCCTPILIPRTRARDVSASRLST